MSIKTGEPIPEAKRGRDFTYPELAQLLPGQCAVFDISADGEEQRIRSAAHYLAKTRGVKFVTRSFPASREFKVWLAPKQPSSIEDK